MSGEGGGKITPTTTTHLRQGSYEQVQISLTNRRICAVDSFPLVNDCDLLAGFSNFPPTPLPSDALDEGIFSSYRVQRWYEKTSYNLVKVAL